MYGFQIILRNTFAPGDLDTVINQLVFRGQEELKQFVDDRDLFIRVVGEIMTEFNMQQPSSAPATYKVGSLGTEKGDKKWIRIFWEDKSMLDRMTEINGETITCEGCGAGL